MWTYAFTYCCLCVSVCVFLSAWIETGDRSSANLMGTRVWRNGALNDESGSSRAVQLHPFVSTLEKHTLIPETPETL